MVKYLYYYIKNKNMDLDKFQPNFEADWFNFEEVKEILLKKVNSRLLKLESDSKSQYEYLKGLFEKEKKEEESLADKVKTKASELQSQATQELKASASEKWKKVLEEAWFWGLVEKLNSFTEGFTWFFEKFKSVWKYIWVVLAPILWIFWIKNLPSWLGWWSEEEKKEENKKVIQNDTNTLTDKKTEENKTTTEKQEKVEVKELISKKEKWYSTLWKLYLKKISTSNILFEKTNDYIVFLSKIEKKDLSFNQIKIFVDKLKKNPDKKTLEEVKKELWLEEITIDIWNVDDFIWTLDTIVWNNSWFVFKNVVISDLLDRKSFKKTFWDKYEKYRWKDIKEIPFKDALFLLGYSLPVWILWNFISFLPTAEDLKDTKKIIEQEVKARETDFFSKEFISMIKLWEFKSPSMIKDDLLEKELKNKIDKETNVELKEKLETDLKIFFSFKNSVLTVLSSGKYNIIPEFKVNFIDKITPLKLFSLYILLNWDTSPDNINWVNKVLSYSWIAELTNDNNLRDKYIKELINKSSIWTNSWEYLTEEEISFIWPIFLWEWYNAFIKRSAEIASSMTSTTNAILMESFKWSSLDSFFKDKWIDVLWLLDKYEILDFVILWTLIWWSFLAYKLPLPLPWKIAIWWTFSSAGAVYLYGILEKKWFIDKIIKDNTIPEDVRKAIIELKEEYSWKVDNDFLDNIWDLI